MSESRRLVIRTSDRTAFKDCRRKWHWTSSSRMNLEGNAGSSPLWMGSGFHYAMEDFHGHKQFPSAKDAFLAYVQACKDTRNFPLPENHVTDTELCCDMVDYYEHNWLRNRDELQTYVVDGHPQCEVKFHIPIPMDQLEALCLEIYGQKVWDDFASRWDEVIYQGTMDRVTIDEHGHLWVLDYKTAANIVHLHYANDQQITNYCWAANLIYDLPVRGFIYQQHRKTLPKEPRLLANGTYSVAKNQVTTYNQYRDALINLYTSIEKAPQANVRYMQDHLMLSEQPDSDLFIHREFVHRNEASLKAEEQNILLEVLDMGNPNLPLYPHPDRDCAWKCYAEQACISMNDGSDWEHTLKAISMSRAEDDNRWQSHLKLP